MSPPQRREDVFLVRVWREPRADRVAPWRGSAYHAPAGRQFYFTDLDELRRYFAAELSEGAAAASAEPIFVNSRGSHPKGSS